MIPTYKLSIDESHNEEGNYLGVLEIANTVNPAIKIKGIALSDIKELLFKDDLKYRIAAPVLTPGKVFRRDPQTGEEYDLDVEPEVVEKMFVKFQRDRSGKDVFNVEHDESQRVPSYILETWLVENPKVDKSLDVYGIECPEKTWFAVQQFTDKEAYQECVDKGMLGFSIHGNASLRMSKQTNKTEIMNKPQMKKRKFVAHFTEASETETGEIIVTADELKEGEEVVVVDENLEEVADFSGEVVIGEQTVVIENDQIKAIGTEEVVAEEAVEMEAEKPEEEVEMNEEKEEVAVEAAEETPAPESETYTKAEIDAKFEEIIALIAEYKTPAEAPVEMSEQKEMTEKELRIARVNSLANMYNKQ
jgi:hypothetical protein